MMAYVEDHMMANGANIREKVKKSNVSKSVLVDLCIVCLSRLLPDTSYSIELTFSDLDAQVLAQYLQRINHT